MTAAVASVVFVASNTATQSSIDLIRAAAACSSLRSANPQSVGPVQLVIHEPSAVKAFESERQRPQLQA